MVVSEFSATQRLFSEFAPFDNSPAARQAFVDSFREVSWHHFRYNPIVAGFWNENHYHPDSIIAEKDLVAVPPIMVNLFKEQEFLSVAKKEIVLTLSSSGTSGQTSQQCLDALSLKNIELIAFRIHEALGITSKKKTHCLCFSYDPAVAGDVGTAFSDKAMTGLTPRGDVYYAFSWDEETNEFRFSRTETLKKLLEFAARDQPVRLFGFPAFIADVLQCLEAPLHLGEDSWVLTGGGWKGRAGEALTKAGFRDLCGEKLGIPPENIRDGFGMVEHGIPYVDCAAGNLHISNYSRVFVRSPRNLSVLPEGEVGILQLLCSYNTSYPSHSLLTTDLGRVFPCPCGHGNALEIVGRAGVNKHKGCAFQAAQLLQP